METLKNLCQYPNKQTLKNKPQLGTIIIWILEKGTRAEIKQGCVGIFMQNKAQKISQIKLSGANKINLFDYQVQI